MNALADRTVIYDSDCGFCTQSARWVSKNGRVNVVPWQGLDLAALGLTEADVMAAAYWYDEGRVKASADQAIGYSLIARGGFPGLLGRIIIAPGVRLLAAPVYRVVAKNRHRLPGGTAACALK